jgi:futalosine hydrolase
MRILIVTATSAEIAPLTDAFAASGSVGLQPDRTVPHRHAGHEIQVLVTGAGMVATAAWCSKELATGGYDLALNLGVCGSFDRALAPGMVVHVDRDRMAELGAEDGERFLSIEDLGLIDADGQPYSRPELRNGNPPQNAALSRLPRVAGITVNTVHGNERSIGEVVERFRPQVESMEGAAFMFACLIHGMPFAQVRAVSNIVERRNRSAWQLEQAIDALAAAARAIIEAA